MEQDKHIERLLIVFLFLVIFLFNLPFARTELLSPDASLYLDIGRNIFSGKGAVTSYNINQYWVKKHHSALTFTHPVYPLVAGLVWFMSNSIRAVIGFNILLFAVNCLLLYKIIRPFTDYLTAFFTVFFLGFSKLTLMSAIVPWTEQLHLFSLLVALFIYFRDEKEHFLVGGILGISCLIRIGSIFNVLAFGIGLIILKGFSRESIAAYLKLCLGFLLVFLTYEVFCFWRYGAIYPERFIAGKNFKIAQLHPGAFFQSGLPALNVPPLEIGIRTYLGDLFTSLNIFLGVFGPIKYLFLAGLLYVLFNPENRRNPLFVIFILQAIGVILGYLNHTSQFGQKVPEVFPKFDAMRYSLIPFLTLVAVTFIAAGDFFTRVLSAKIKQRYALLFISLVFVSFFAIEGQRYLIFRNYFLHEYPRGRRDYTLMRDEMYAWIKSHSLEDDLIASQYFGDGFLLERPFIAIPNGKALNKKNVEDFLAIFKPRYVLTDDLKLIKFLKGFGLVKKKTSGYIVALGKT